LDDWNESFHLLKKFSVEKKNGYEALWGRGCEIGTKIALILAVGDGAVHIDEHHAQYGCTLFMRLMEQFIDSAKSEVGDSQRERDRKKLYAVIKKADDKGATLSELTRVSQSITRRERLELLHELADMEFIYIEAVEGTRGVRCYDAKKRA
jgi:hypothetical protein